MAEKTQKKAADPAAKTTDVVSEATYGGQPGEIVEMPEDRKPDPTTIAHEQIVDETE